MCACGGPGTVVSYLNDPNLLLILPIAYEKGWDYFTPATFQDMPDSEKLDTPSFEKVCPFCGYKNKLGNNVCETCGASI